jgi:uncharacterized protein (UPF0332 family)
MDKVGRAVKEAESWLDGSKRIAGAGDCNVACAMAIHSIIRANDALTLRFLGRTATRHDDAHILFGKLIRQGKLPEGEIKFQLIVARAMQEKSRADYGKGEFSKTQMEKFVEDAEGFLGMTKEYL